MDDKVYIGIGSNLGDRLGALREASERLAALEGCEVVRASAVYETEPWGVTNQPEYLNCVVECRTGNEPELLVRSLRSIEMEMGRRQAQRNIPRHIDLDILLFGDRIISLADLDVPHPRMHLRNFVLVPLAELAPDARHPLLGRTVREIIETGSGTGEVRIYSRSLYPAASKEPQSSETP